MINFRPMGDKILVEPLTSRETYVGPIQIPERHQDASVEGIVVAVGPGKVNRKGVLKSPEVKIGDRVLTTRFSGTEIKIGRRQFRMMEPIDVIAIVQ